MNSSQVGEWFVPALAAGWRCLFANDLRCGPGEKVLLSATVSFAAMTTRRHYPGHHRIDVLINGTAHSPGEFEVLA